MRAVVFVRTDRTSHAIECEYTVAEDGRDMDVRFGHLYVRGGDGRLRRLANASSELRRNVYAALVDLAYESLATVRDVVADARMDERREQAWQQ